MSEVIPAEAVEAAAQLIYRSSGRHRVMTYDEARANCHAEAMAILEAAAPHMLAAPGSSMREAMRLAWEQGWANARGNYLALRQGQEIPEWVTLRNPYGD